MLDLEEGQDFSYDDIDEANDILKYLIQQNLGSCERKYPLLFEYYKSL